MRREECSDYPYKAVREVLVNALIHRDYQILGSEIHVDIFDDRLEIFSPGGMMNGQRIQDMDLHHIPSMRRNQVISDVFSRLDLMERRGSGIDRILNSYAEVTQKPSFYSDSDIFLVTLPNRSVAEPAQIAMKVATSLGNVASSTPEVATSGTKVASVSFREETERPLDEDMEMLDFQNRLKATNFSSKTIQNTLELFKRYRYQYPFHSINVAELYHVKTSRANAIIRDLKTRGFVEEIKYGAYQFIKLP